MISVGGRSSVTLNPVVRLIVGKYTPSIRVTKGSNTTEDSKLGERTRGGVS